MKRLIILLVLALIGCDPIARPSFENTPGPLQTSVASDIRTVVVPGGLNSNLSIREFCYQGSVYLLNERGGMAPKMYNANGAAVATCKEN